MKCIIFGKNSNLSESLSKKLKKDAILISSRDFYLNSSKYNHLFSKGRYDVVINSFSPSNNLKNIVNYEEFINQSIYAITKFLKFINHNRINKLLFSSSVSVKGIKSNIEDYNVNTSIYASSKFLIENLISNYCKRYNISYHICRISNIFGGSDTFSIIYKFINTKKNKINIYNNGNAARDFIHVDEVANIYVKLLSSKISNNVLDIGTGRQFRVREIIDSYNLSNKINYSNKNIIENFFIKNNVTDLEKIYSFKKSLSLNNYLNKLFNKKVTLNYFNPIQNRKLKCVFYGAGIAAKQFLKLKSNKHYFDNISFFVDDDRNLIGKKLMGKPIFSYKQLLIFCKSYEIEEVVIAITNISENKKQRIYNKLINLSQNIITIPIKKNLVTNKISSFDVDDNNFQYLFNKKVRSFNKKFLKLFKNKTILITGGAGSIGSGLVSLIIQSPLSKVVIVDNSEFSLYELKNKLINSNLKNYEIILGDISDTAFLINLFKKFEFDYVYHAAAYKHVNLLEENIRSAIKNNIIATEKLISICNQQKKKIYFTFISTDKADQPKSVLGYTKRICEIICKIYTNKFLNLSIVRFGNVYGSKGSAVPLFIKQIKENLPITITHKKVERYFMSITQACNLVIQTSQITNFNNKIFILDMGKPIKILDLVKKLILIYGNNYDNVIKVVGLGKGEKLKETLSFKQKLYKSPIKDIFFIKDKSYKSSYVKNFLKEINHNIDNPKYKLLKNMKYFLNS